MKLVATPCLPPEVYFDPAVLEVEKERLLRRSWQWAGLLDDAQKPGGFTVTIAEVPVAVEMPDGHLRVSLDLGARRNSLPGAGIQACGRFVFVHLAPEPAQDLETFLGDYAAVLRHASENFDEVYDTGIEVWENNWKAGLEVTLEGYHVAFVHPVSGFSEAVPESTHPTFNGPHSSHTGLVSKTMRAEMANIAKRLKIQQSELYRNYDHFTLFPNMTIGFSGGCLCFIQIYSPLGPEKSELRYSYIMARPIDPAQKPVAAIKKALLDAWRKYTDKVLGEDQAACEGFQRGVRHAIRTGVAARNAEKCLIHFQDHWRKVMENTNGINRS